MLNLLGVRRRTQAFIKYFHGNFYLKSGKVRFEINIDASQRENLKISSKLLRLARIVNSPCD
jgi:hypothetical protein